MNVLPMAVMTQNSTQRSGQHTSVRYCCGQGMRWAYMQACRAHSSIVTGRSVSSERASELLQHVVHPGGCAGAATGRRLHAHQPTQASRLKHRTLEGLRRGSSPSCSRLIPIQYSLHRDVDVD